MPTLLTLSNGIQLADWEVEIAQIRAQGPGGQNVNKVSAAVHLRFDIRRSSLPAFCKERLLHLSDQRISKEGVIVIKAQQFRTLEQNREDALQRLQALIETALKPIKKRRPTRPTRGSQLRRMAQKNQRGKLKSLRGRVETE